MMNKRRTSLMAVVLVSTTMLFTPIQADIPEDCMNEIGKFFKGVGKGIDKVFKVVMMTAEGVTSVVGATIAGAAYHFDSTEKIVQAFKSHWIGGNKPEELFPVKLILLEELKNIIERETKGLITGKTKEKLIKELVEKAKVILDNRIQFLIHLRTPLIVAAGGVATIALMLFVRNLIKNDNKSKTHDEKHS